MGAGFSLLGPVHHNDYIAAIRLECTWESVLRYRSEHKVILGKLTDMPVIYASTIAR